MSDKQTIEFENSPPLTIDNELDELLTDFQDMEIAVSDETKNAIVPLKDLSDPANLEKFVQDKAQNLVSKGLEALETLMDDAQSSGDPELIESVSKFASAISSSIEILNKQVLKNKDHQNKLEVEKLKRDKTLKDGLDEVKGFVTSREEAFKAILEEIKIEEDKKDAIDVDE